MTSDRVAKRPTFTVVMNVYNGEAWLHESLASVFAQTYTDWELLFWDDQSTDESASVLKDFPADPRIRYVYAQEQVPLGKARELAIQEARGEWLAFLDQDDIWTPDKLEKQAKAIALWSGQPLGIVYGRAMKFGIAQVPQDFDHWHEFGELPVGRIFDALFEDSCFICQSAVCLRTDVARDVGPIPDAFRFCPDYFLYTEISSTYEATCTQDVVCWYRLHQTSMSRERYEEVLEEMLHVLDRWTTKLSPEVVTRRRKIQHTMLGLRQISSGRDVAGGLRQLLSHGSLPYLFSRPFARGLRSFRRRIRYARNGVPTPPEAPKRPLAR